MLALSCVNLTAIISNNSNKSQKDNTNRTNFESNSNKNSIPSEICLKFAGINTVDKNEFPLVSRVRRFETHKRLLSTIC